VAACDSSMEYREDLVEAAERALEVARGRRSDRVEFHRKTN
jgi:hypothetical protein